MRALGRDTGGKDAGGSLDPAPQGSEAAPESPEHDSGWAEETPDVQGGSGPAWLTPALAMLAVAGWTGFFGWPIWQRWRGRRAASVGRLDRAMGRSGCLIGIVWLLALRTSYAEARRFAGIAARMSRESTALEARLKVVNRELSLAREFLAAEARDLDALGRMAAERLSPMPVNSRTSSPAMVPRSRRSAPPAKRRWAT